MRVRLHSGARAYLHDPEMPAIIVAAAGEVSEDEEVRLACRVQIFIREGTVPEGTGELLITTR